MSNTTDSKVGAKRFWSFFGFNREAKRLRAELEEKEKELEEAKKAAEEPKSEPEPEAEPEAEKTDATKAEEAKEPNPEATEAKTGAETVEPKAEKAKPDNAAEKELNVEEHLDEFFWYLKAHPVYTRMLLNSSEALSAKSVAVFFNRFTDPKHERMLTKKDIKETVKKNFGGDLEKACAEHGGWFDREYRVADEKGNPTGEKMTITTTTASSDSSGAD